MTDKDIADIITIINASYYAGEERGGWLYGLRNINELLSTVKFGPTTDSAEMSAWLRGAFAGRDRMPEHARLVREAKTELALRGWNGDMINRLLKGMI